MMEWISICVIFVGGGSCILLTPRDVDPHFLEHQASVSATKQAGESPVVRSLANPHGHLLLGESRPLSKFRFKDVWVDANTFRIHYVTQKGQIRTLDHLMPLVHRVQCAIADYPVGSRIGSRFDVGVEASISFFAVVLSGRVPVIVDEDENAEDYDAENLTEEHNESVLGRSVKAVPIVLSRAEFKFAMESSGITVKQPSGASVVVSLQDVDKKNTKSEGDVEINEKVGADTPVIEHYLELSDGVERMTCSLNEVDLGVAIAAQLTASGSQNRWSHHDSVFMAPGPLSVYSFVAMLTALSAKAPLIFAETGPMLTATSVLQICKPTVSVSDDETMRTLVKHVDDFQALNWLVYGCRRLRLARGALTQPPMIPEFKSVRSLHSASGSNPYKWLSNADISTLRVLTGVQVIHAYTPTNDSPIAQTSIGDYRAFSRSKEESGVNWGPPLPGLELKKSTTSNEVLIRRANHANWESLPKESSEDALLSRDGCLHVPEKRHDFSDYYYYTGELK